MIYLLARSDRQFNRKKPQFILLKAANPESPAHLCGMKNDRLYLIALYTLRGLGFALLALIPATFFMKPRLHTGIDDLMPGTLLIEQPVNSPASSAGTLMFTPSKPMVQATNGDVLTKS